MQRAWGDEGVTIAWAERARYPFGVRLHPCDSCNRPVQRDVPCPFCGAGGVPTTVAPRVMTWLLSVPLAAAACTSSAETNPKKTAPAPAKQGASKPEPPVPAKADPPPPGEPQGEIYGTPQMMDERQEKAEAAPAEAPVK